ncbi:MAG: hypothetical protein Q7W51_04895 [Coriobacteriia bacterium]|nr:hypothetical protein [Coriobacteriia bacterium]
MTDKIRARLSFLLYASMFVLPGASLAIGWIGWGFRTGVVAALITFVICFLLAGVLLATVKDLSWIAVGLPFALGMTYAALPNFIPTPFDNTAMATAGALMTFGLWVRKQPDTPKWIVFPLLVSALYTLVGGFIAGPVDELIVGAISFYTSRHVAAKQLPPSSEPQAIDADEYIAAEYVAQED